LRDVLLHADFAGAPPPPTSSSRPSPGLAADPRLRWQMAAAAALHLRGPSDRAGDPWQFRDGFRLVGSAAAAPAQFEVALADAPPLL